MENFVLCQISNKLINPPERTTAEKYYNALYDNNAEDGYFRPKHFWELPLWIAELSYILKGKANIELHIVDGSNDLPNSKEHAFYCFSVLEVNKEMIRSIIQNNPDKHFCLGGYVDSAYFSTCNNVLWFDSLIDFSYVFAYDYKQGTNWELFKGENTIPRLTLSTGCINKCSFCTVPNKVVALSNSEVLQQVKSFKDLNFKLVYLNDKTYGQAENYKQLGKLYHIITGYNPEFEGFIVQTTVLQVLKLKPKFYKALHIKVVELGIETYNNDLLIKYNKPQNETKILEAMELLKGVKVICNIILGLIGETEKTYKRTLSFLDTQQFYALNIYTLALYADSRLGETIEVTANDANELATDRTFWNASERTAFNKYADLFYLKGLQIVCKGGMVC